jgi:hypothetical protein
MLVVLNERLSVDGVVLVTTTPGPAAAAAAR